MGYTRYRFVGDGTSHVGSYSTLVTDSVIMVSHSSSTYTVLLTGNFQGNIPDGMTITIKDATGTCSFFPITITAASGQGFVGGVTSHIINEDFGFRTFVWVAAFAAWEQIGGYVQPAITSFELTGNTNDFLPIADTPGAPVGVISFTTNGSSWNVTGLNIGNPPIVPGRRIVIWNGNVVGATTVTLKNEDAGSSSINRFIGVGGVDRVLNKNESTEVCWSGGPVNRWRILY